MHIDVRLSSGGVRGVVVAACLLKLCEKDTPHRYIQAIVRPTLGKDTIDVAGVSIGAVLGVALACKNKARVLKQFLHMVEDRKIIHRAHKKNISFAVLQQMFRRSCPCLPPPASNFGVFSCNELMPELDPQHHDALFKDQQLDKSYTVYVASCRVQPATAPVQKEYVIDDVRNVTRLQQAVAIPGLIAPVDGRFDGAACCSVDTKALDRTLKHCRTKSVNAVFVFMCTPLLPTLNLYLKSDAAAAKHRAAVHAYRGPNALPDTMQQAVGNMQTLASLYDMATIETTLGIDLTQLHDEFKTKCVNVLYMCSEDGDKIVARKDKTPNCVPLILCAPTDHQFRQYKSINLTAYDAADVKTMMQIGAEMAEELQKAVAPLAH